MRKQRAPGPRRQSGNGQLGGVAPGGGRGHAEPGAHLGRRQAAALAQEAKEVAAAFRNEHSPANPSGNRDAINMISFAHIAHDRSRSACSRCGSPGREGTAVRVAPPCTDFGLLLSFITVSSTAFWHRTGGRPRMDLARCRPRRTDPSPSRFPECFPRGGPEGACSACARARCSAGIGSSGQTSIAARIWPPAAASSRSPKLTIPARLTRMTKDPLAILQKSWDPIRPAFSVVAAARRKTTAAREKHSSRVAGTTPFPAGTPASIHGS